MMNDRTPTGIPPREQCVLRYLIEDRAAERPDHEAVVFPGGERWTFAELARRVSRAGRQLQDQGVRQGDTVFVWMPNGPEMLVWWCAINHIGAIYVPANTAYRGRLLEHVLENSGARIAIVHAGLVERLAAVSTAALATLIVSGGDAPAIAGLAQIGVADLPETGDALPLDRPIEPWDTFAIIYTSGTTGPSKGVICSYLQVARASEAQTWVGADDRVLTVLPLFHMAACIEFHHAFARGATMIALAGFSTDRFWPTVREHRVTKASLLGVMCAFLVKQPVSPDDAQTTLAAVLSIPYTPESLAFGRRFGVDVHTFFNMTETNMPIVSPPNPTALGSCGRPRAGVEARIVDAHDRPVPTGQTGELVLRCDTPWELSTGYHRNAEASAAVWRNGWFHTGDGFRQDEDGNFYFVDRLKDAIRRRGENISSHEVELEVTAHEAVREAAVIGVPSEDSEEEVMVVVALMPGAALDPADLFAFLRPRLAHFMLPRYIRIVDELPKTPTQKITKHVLRDGGVTPDSWDRSAHGIVVRRETLAG